MLYEVITLSLFLLCFFFSSCAGYHVKCYNGPKLPDSEVSVITTEDQFTTIGGIDGKRTIKRTNLWHFLMYSIWGQEPRKVSVLPGEHALLPCHENPFWGVSYNFV